MLPCLPHVPCTSAVGPGVKVSVKHASNPVTMVNFRPSWACCGGPKIGHGVFILTFTISRNHTIVDFLNQSLTIDVIYIYMYNIHIIYIYTYIVYIYCFIYMYMWNCSQSLWQSLLAKPFATTSANRGVATAKALVAASTDRTVQVSAEPLWWVRLAKGIVKIPRSFWQRVRGVYLFVYTWGAYKSDITSIVKIDRVIWDHAGHIWHSLGAVLATPPPCRPNAAS